MTSEKMQCLNPLIKIGIPVKKTDKPNGKNVVIELIDVLTNVVTLMYWGKVIIVELWLNIIIV